MPQVKCRVLSEVETINHIINDVLTKSEKKNSELINIQREQTHDYNPVDTSNLDIQREPSHYYNPIQKSNLENNFGLHMNDFKESETDFTPRNDIGVDIEPTEVSAPREGIFDKKPSPFLRNEQKLTTCLKLRDIIMDFHKIYSDTLSNFQDKSDSSTKKPETENHASSSKTYYVILSDKPNQLHKHSTENNAESTTKPFKWPSNGPTKEDYIYKAISLATVVEAARSLTLRPTKSTSMRPFIYPNTQISDLLEMTKEKDNHLVTMSLLDRIRVDEETLRNKISSNFSYFDDYGNIKNTFKKLKPANEHKEINKVYQILKNKPNSEQLNDLADDLALNTAMTITNNNGQGAVKAFTNFPEELNHGRNNIDLRLLEQAMKEKKLTTLSLTLSSPKVYSNLTSKMNENKFVTMPFTTETHLGVKNITTKIIKAFDKKISGRNTEHKGADETDSKKIQSQANHLDTTVTFSKYKIPENDNHFFKKLLANDGNIMVKDESSRAHAEERYSRFSSKSMNKYFKTTTPHPKVLSQFTENTPKTMENQDLNDLYKKIIEKYEGLKNYKTDNNDALNEKYFDTASPQKVTISMQKITMSVKEDINEANKQKSKYYDLEDMSKKIFESEKESALKTKAQAKTYKLDKDLGNIENLLPDIIDTNNIQFRVTDSDIYQSTANNHQNTINYEDKHRSPITEATNRIDSKTKHGHHGKLSENSIDALYKEIMKRPGSKLKDSDIYQSTIYNHGNTVNYEDKHRSRVTEATNRLDSKTKQVQHRKLSENSIDALYKEIMKKQGITAKLYNKPKNLKNELKSLEANLPKKSTVKVSNLPDYRHTQEQILAKDRKEMENLFKEVIEASESTPDIKFERFHTQKSKTQHSTIEDTLMPNANVNTEKGVTIPEKKEHSLNPKHRTDSKVSDEKNTHIKWSIDKITNLPDYRHTQEQNLATQTKEMENMFKEVITTSDNTLNAENKFGRFHTQKSKTEHTTIKELPEYKLHKSTTVNTEAKPERMHEKIFKHLNWDRVKQLFGHDRVCNCKCRVNRTMCRACAASDEVMRELIFEFNNMEDYMKRHCTEIQTFFWMNPTGGKKLRDSVHRIDKSMEDYYKRVRGKCTGRTCKTFATYLDKRSSTVNSNNYVGFRSENL